MQEAGPLDLLLPDPSDLCLLEPKFLPERGVLTLPVQKRLPVVACDHCGTGNGWGRCRLRARPGPQAIQRWAEPPWGWGALDNADTAQ